MLQIDSLVNYPIPSNTYVISGTSNENECVIVDPGSKDSSSLLHFLDRKKLVPIYIILTHEHPDHVWGCNDVRERYGSKIVCSHTCNEKIKRPQNYFNLLYFNDDEMLQINNVDFLIEDIDFNLKWGDAIFTFIKTPGHSISSICISLDNLLFTGDTVVKGHKPVIIKRHEGSIHALKSSINQIFNSFSLDTQIFPGHGPAFQLSEVKDQYKAFLL